MIQVPAQASVFVMHESVSFRRGIDGMAAVARVVLGQEPMSGAFFVFRNRGRHMLRVVSARLREKPRWPGYSEWGEAPELGCCAAPVGSKSRLAGGTADQ